MSDFLQQSLDYYKSLTLSNGGDCHLIGVSPEGEIFVEEVFGADDKFVSYAINFDGEKVVDEVNEKPQELVRPCLIEKTTALNFSIGRFRGMREAERIADVVRPLTVQEKMALVKALKLTIMPPLLLGIAESVVLAEAVLDAPYRYLVCRRLRLAYALGQARVDAFGQAYDYDTTVMYLAHEYDVREREEAELHETIAASQALLAGVVLHRPMDCLVYGEYLLIADGGDGTRASAIHLWKLTKDSKRA